MVIGQQLQSAGIKTVIIGQMALKEVRFMPGLDRNLMSISALDKNGWKLTFEREEATLLRGGQSLSFRKSGGVYSIIINMTILTAYASHTKLVSKLILEQLLHKRMGHLNQKYVRLLPQVAKQEF
jgi:hypothetical protein